MQIYCCGCGDKVEARLTDGAEIYPHRTDLSDVPLWRCDECGNYVGCHYKRKKNPTEPMGYIPTSEIREARKHIHAILDPIWKSGRKRRGALYRELTDYMGWRYHTSKIRTVEEGRKVYRYLLDNYGK